MMNQTILNKKWICTVVSVAMVLSMSTVTFAGWGQKLELDILKSTGNKCAGDLKITDVNYVVSNPGQEREIIEFEGTKSALLDGFEIQVFDSSGKTIFTQALDGRSTSSSGKFLVAEKRETLEVENHSVFVAATDFIPDVGPGSIVIFDKKAGGICHAVNYQGSPTGMGQWQNIGTDYPSNLPTQGCSQGSQLSWNCQSYIDSAKPLSIVQIELSDQKTASTTTLLPILLVGTAVTLTGVAIRSRKS